MIPVHEKTINSLNVVSMEMPSRSYYFDISEKRIRGMTDRQEAMKQAIYLIINTERYQYPIYSWAYGIELLNLIGQPIPYALSEIKRRITDALLHDDRILSLDSWGFEVKRRVVTVSFTAHTSYGVVEINREVPV